MDMFGDGSAAATSWLEMIREQAGKNAWVFEDGYLRDDGYELTKDDAGEPCWVRKSPPEAS